MIRSTLTDAWETTIPPEVRAALHLHPRQGLLYEIHGQSVTIRAEGETDQSADPGSRAPGLSKEGEREAARLYVLKNYLGLGHDD